MAIYEIYAEAGKSGDGSQNPLSASRIEFIRDGLFPVALVLPGLWLIWHRLWFELIAYVLFSLCLIAAVYNGVWFASWLGFLPGLYLFLEGGQVLAAKLRRNGKTLLGVSEGRNLETAELRWFHTNKALFERAEASSKKSGMQNTFTGAEESFGIFGGE